MARHLAGQTTVPEERLCFSAVEADDHGELYTLHIAYCPALFAVVCHRLTKKEGTPAPVANLFTLNGHRVIHFHEVLTRGEGVQVRRAC